MKVELLKAIFEKHRRHIQASPGAGKDCQFYGIATIDDIENDVLAAAPIAPPVAQEMALTFDAFRAANVARCVKWHPAGIASWSPSDWLVAVTGELGELASLLKMRNRERDGLPGNKFSPTDKMVADELADVLTYLDLLAETLGVNLGQAAATKFNEVSERVGFPDRIDAHPPRRELPPEPANVVPIEMWLRGLAEQTKLFGHLANYDGVLHKRLIEAADRLRALIEQQKR